tara:strand:- start:2683 stop:2937 length:255 start_codon:yes stop_codon:yes gene_type:complete
MEQDINRMYNKLVEKLEYQNRAAAEHDFELKKGIKDTNHETARAMEGNRAVLHSMLNAIKIMIALQIANLGANTETLSSLLRLL